MGDHGLCDATHDESLKATAPVRVKGSVQLLLEHGADPNLPEEQCVHEAARKGDVREAKKRQAAFVAAGGAAGARSSNLRSAEAVRHRPQIAVKTRLKLSPSTPRISASE